VRVMQVICDSRMAAPLFDVVIVAQSFEIFEG
jgi:hypothetical protein